MKFADIGRITIRFLIIFVLFEEIEKVRYHFLFPFPVFLDKVFFLVFTCTFLKPVVLTIEIFLDYFFALIVEVSAFGHDLSR